MKELGHFIPPIEGTTYDPGQMFIHKTFAYRGTFFSGMDCVSHCDILPYLTTENSPMEHDLFERIFNTTGDRDGLFIYLFILYSDYFLSRTKFDIWTTATYVALCNSIRFLFKKLQPELNVHSPAFQFSSTVELPHSKGGHMWGRFKMERVL
uniref:ApaG domain-containing protein n=1 Tax=Heterorhabditis bacteriophora TaxID=37862 RepID=A0A1I7WJU9_HETBA